MDITPLLPAHALPIRNYGPAGFTLGEVPHEGSVLVTPNGVRDLRAGDADAQIAEALSGVLQEPGIELLLIGTGAQMRYVEEDLRDPLRTQLRTQGIATEIMDTGAACRTYNVLLAEGRRVAAVLVLPV